MLKEDFLLLFRSFCEPVVSCELSAMPSTLGSPGSNSPPSTSLLVEERKAEVSEDLDLIRDPDPEDPFLQELNIRSPRWLELERRLQKRNTNAVLQLVSLVPLKTMRDFASSFFLLPRGFGHNLFYTI